MNALQRYWRGLGQRERKVLASGAAALVLVLGYVLLWEPLVDSRNEWRNRVATAQADLAWMRATAPQVRERNVGAPVRSSDGRSLLARVDASAREAGLGGSLLRVEPVADGQVRVYFEDAGFDAVVRWVETLSAQYGTRVGELSAQRADGVGRVDVRLSLEESTR